MNSSVSEFSLITQVVKHLKNEFSDPADQNNLSFIEGVVHALSCQLENSGSFDKNLLQEQIRFILEDEVYKEFLKASASQLFEAIDTMEGNDD